MNKAIQHPVEVTLVTKDNFIDTLSSFKSNLSNPLLDYIVFNCDFSTLTKSNPNREIIFTEIALCLKVNTSQDITHRVLIYLIPSIKFNKYLPDSKISFSSESLKYLMHNKAVYSLKNLTSKNALSYSNLSNEPPISSSLSRILIDGKKSKKENMKSYYYYPKALNLPSLKFQRRLEEIIKQMAMTIIQVDDSMVLDSNEAKYVTIPLIDEANYNVVNEVFGFKWNLLFQPYTTDMIKVYIEGIEISWVKPINNALVNKEAFNDFIRLINEVFKSKGKNEQFRVIKVFEDSFYENWRLFLLNEIKGKITINNNPSSSSNTDIQLQSGNGNGNGFEPMIEFNILREEETKVDHITTLLSDLWSFFNRISSKGVEDSNISTLTYVSSNIPVLISNLYLNNWNIASLFPKEIAQLCSIKYHFGVKLDMKTIKIDKENTDAIIKKISYEKLYLNIDNKEDILFGYEFETEVHKMLVDMMKKKESNSNSIGYISIKQEYAIDLKAFLQFKDFNDIIASIANTFTIEDNKKASSSYSNGISYSMMSTIDSLDSSIAIDSIRKEICDKGCECKTKLLIQEELGVSLFYKELFASNQCIYGSNLFSKLSFILTEVFNNDLTSMNISLIKDFYIRNKSLLLYDLNYIAKANQFPLYEQYSSLAKEGIGNITLRFHYIINKMKGVIQKSNANCLSHNDMYCNMSLTSNTLEPIRKEDNNKGNGKSIIISKERLVKNQLLSIVKTYGNFILNPQQGQQGQDRDTDDKSIVYRLDFLDSEDKFKHLNKTLSNLI